MQEPYVERIRELEKKIEQLRSELEPLSDLCDDMSSHRLYRDARGKFIKWLATWFAFGTVIIAVISFFGYKEWQDFREGVRGYFEGTLKTKIEKDIESAMTRVKKRADDTELAIEAKKDIAITRTESMVNKYLNDLAGKLSRELQRPELITIFQDEASFFDDPINRLEWAIPKITPRSWRGASEYAKYTRLKGHADWRLPKIEEAKKLMDSVKDLGALGFERGFYWTNSRHMDQAKVFNPYERTAEFDQDTIYGFNWLILVRNSKM